MAQAAIDLPQNSNDPTSSNTDELLSQLAGSEIDRLLAEADSAGEGEESTESQNVAPESSEDHALNAQLDTLLNEAEKMAPVARGNAAPALPAAPPLESAAGATEGAERAALLQAAGFDATAGAAAAAAADNAEAKGAGEERSALLQAAGFETDAQAEAAGDSEAATLADLHTAVAEEASLPIYLKPLEWINAPLASAPEALRQVLGKAAIITLLNAIAVIMYVIVFRKH